MENASKALIIAGAILISILLISVGVLIMNSTGDTTGSVEDSAGQIAIRTFNSNFEPYLGENQSASQIRALKSAVNASNAKTPDHRIDLVPADLALKSSKKYKVTEEYAKDGYINKLTIVDQSTVH